MRGYVKVPVVIGLFGWSVVRGTYLNTPLI